MASSALSSLFSRATFKISKGAASSVVAPNLKIIKVTIKLSSTAMRHANEDGTTTTDTRIIKPAMVAIDAYCPDMDTINQVNAIMLDRESQYSVSSRGITIDGLLPLSENARQTPEVLTATPVRISFKSVPTDSKPSAILGQSADSTIVNRGMVLVNNAKQNVAELSAKVKAGVDQVKGLIGG